jgi:type I restriction enzyme, R subunit
LAKWILENKHDARVVIIITDRDELDKQIQRVFEDAGEEILRTESGEGLDVPFGPAEAKTTLLLGPQVWQKGCRKL